MSDVLRLHQLSDDSLQKLLAGFGLRLQTVAADETIPGSFWGDEEAGLIGNRLLARADTPVHSILHEACHYICMPPERRDGLHTNAGGDYDEENAVCYLQILLAGALPAMGRARMFDDMDRWGYSFRLGSAQRWFGEDAEDARQLLLHWQLITTDGTPTGEIRKQA